MPASHLSYRRPHQARGFEIRPKMRIVKWSPEYDHFILVNMWTPPAVKYAKLFLSDSTKGVKFGHLRESSCRLGNLHFLARKLIDKSEIHFSCTCQVQLDAPNQKEQILIFGFQRAAISRFKVGRGDPKIWIHTDEAGLGKLSEGYNRWMFYSAF